MLRSPYNDRQLSWTGTGFVQLFPQSSIEFSVDNVPESKLYDIVIRYEPTMNGQFDAEVVVQRPGGISSFSPCYNHSHQGDVQSVKLNSMARNVHVRGVCLEKNARYTIELKVHEADQRNHDGSAPSVLIDSVSSSLFFPLSSDN